MEANDHDWFETVADRVWWGWHCLPRSARGKPPPWKPLEKEHKIPLATFSKLFSGERKTVEVPTAKKLAELFGTTLLWILDGDGEPPKLTGPIERRRDQYQEHDPAQWAKMAVGADGTIDASLLLGVNNFDEATRSRQVRDNVDAGTIMAVKERFRDRYPNGLTAIGWLDEIIDEQRKRDAKKPTRREPKKKDPPVKLAETPKKPAHSKSA